jgi:hypothetical protein
MPLTRHLYELDEVVSALQYCLLNKCAEGRSLFWFWELVVSSETDIAIQTVVDVCLCLGCAMFPFPYPCPENTDALITLFVTAYTNIITNTTTRGLLDLLEFKEARPHLTPIAPTNAVRERRRMGATEFAVACASDCDQNTAVQFWISLDSACRQGEPAKPDVVWLLRAAQTRLSPSSIWSGLRISNKYRTNRTNHTRAAESLDFLQAYASTSTNTNTIQTTTNRQFLCQLNAVIASDATPVSVNTSWSKRLWAEWSAIEGHRSARQFPIPLGALHSQTTRGRMEFKYTNIGDVRDPLILLATEGCRFWQHVLTVLNIRVCSDETDTEDTENDEIQFPSDSVLEQFYDQYFPDDIPDEWSKQDQEKSHGRGLLAKPKSQPPPQPPMILSVLDSPANDICDAEWTVGICVREL